MAEREQLSPPIPSQSLIAQMSEAFTEMQDEIKTLQGHLNDQIHENISLQDELSPLRSFKTKALPRLRALQTFLENLDEAGIACALQTFSEGKWSTQQRADIHDSIGLLQMSLIFLFDGGKLLEDIDNEIGYEGER